MREYKCSEDLEIFELDYTTNSELQVVCNLKQPIVFDTNNIIMSAFISKVVNRIDITKCPTELNIYDIHEFNCFPHETVQPIELSLRAFEKLCATDTKHHFITENNEDFVDECGLYGDFEKLDNLLKDYFVVKKYYDILLGSTDAVFPLRFHKNSRQFYLVAEGKIRVKMTSQKNSKYLHQYNDMSVFEFGSPVNVWEPQSEFKKDLDKILFLEFDVMAGSVLYLPPYWWSSIKIIEDKTIICGITYYTLPNVLANASDIFNHWRERDIEKDSSKISTSHIILENVSDTKNDIIDKDIEIREK